MILLAPACKRFLRVRGKICALVTLLSMAPAGAAVRGSSPALPAFTPIHAELVGPMDARFLKPGSPLLLKVKDAWHNDDCKLREGSILKGHVVAANVSSKEDRVSKVALVVDEAECNGPTLVPMPLAVAAMMAPDPVELGNMQEYAPLDAGPVAMGSGTGTGSLRSISTASFIAENSALPVAPPKRMSLGDVVGLSGLRLSVGTGPEQSTVLSDKGRNVSLQRDTQFVLIPAALIRREAPPSAAVAPSPSAAAPPVVSRTLKAEPPPAPPEPDVEVCAPPSCNIALSSADTTPEVHAAKSVSLRELGYAPRYGVELDDFNHEAALAYLGNGQLLVTFNPHTLIRRGQNEDERDAARVVRAALLDTGTLRVIRTIDWHVADRRQYLWPAGEDRVLAHVGNELRVYGPDLKIERRIELQGPLAWVRVAPSKKTFAIGVIEERHSKELHAQLVAESNVEPEEDVEVRILDADFRTMVTAIRSSRFMPPVLTDSGEVGLYLQGGDRFHLVEHTWDHQTRSIAHFQSSCMPQVSSVAPGLLFVVSCSRTSGAKYKVLRLDGRPLLQGASTSEQLGQAAHGSSRGQAFVVGIAQADHPLSPGQIFHPSDLTEERLSVYRSADGRRIFATRVDSPAPAREAYALAPDAGELAVLSAEQISLYRVPAQ